MGPLIPYNIIDPSWNLLIALLLGMAFGFVLESSGFSSSRKLAGVFYGYDFVVLRVFFTAAITAILGMAYFDYLGIMDLSIIYINPAYINSAILGGVVMGLGFILGGFCPGTSFCAVAIGKIDAMVFTVGMFLGIFAFSETFPMIENLYYNNSLGPVKVYDYLGISSGLFIFLLIIIAIIAFIVTRMIEKRTKKVIY
jgi:hypothetical protein